MTQRSSAKGKKRRKKPEKLEFVQDFIPIKDLHHGTMTSNRRPIKLYILLRSTRGAVCINAIAIWLITVLLVFLISQKTRAELFIQ